MIRITLLFVVLLSALLVTGASARTPLTWDAKDSGGELWGPGPNVWRSDNVVVEGDTVTLSVRQVDGVWTSGEAILDRSLGYGRYEFTLLQSPYMDANVVLGLFIWDEDPASPYNREIDIEFARWGNQWEDRVGHFTFQPWQDPGRQIAFRPVDGPQTCSFTWLPMVIRWKCAAISWSYYGSDVPVPGTERVRMNLWTIGSPSSATSVSVRFRR